MRIVREQITDAIHNSRKISTYSQKNYFPDWLECENLTHAIDTLNSLGFTVGFEVFSSLKTESLLANFPLNEIAQDFRAFGKH